MKHFTRILLTLCLPGLLWPAIATAQMVGDESLSGDYHFVHLLVSVSLDQTVTDARNLGGTITFDGAGSFTYSGRLGSGAGAPAPSMGAGVYSVQSNGFVTLTNPIAGGLEINARLGEGSEALIGSSTEAADGSTDLFIAIKAPPGTASSGTLSGAYTGSTLAFPGGSDASITTALLRMQANGAGAFTALTVRGHATNVSQDTNFEENTSAATYTLGGDGKGTAALGQGATLFSGARDIFVSANGNYLIGHSTEDGGREIFVAVRNLSDAASDADWNGTYWFAEMIIDPAFQSFTSAVGGLSSLGASVATISERVLSDGFSSDFSTVNDYEVNADSTGQLGAVLENDTINMGLGAPSAGVPQAAVGAQISGLGFLSPFHGIFIAIRMPSLSEPGVFLHPLGVVNGASFAPPTFPIAAGTIVSLFGAGMAPEGTSVQADTTPLPVILAGVSVTVNGAAAPLFFVSPGLINIQVPFASAGASATIVVTNNGTESNVVTTPLAATSPGIFTATQNGLGRGIIVHAADFRLVTEQDPAVPGEFIAILLTGLGAVNPPVEDGVAAPSVEPLARATDGNIRVLFGFEAFDGQITFSGAAPFFVGLYQINVLVPDLLTVGSGVPIAIVTTNAVSDFATIPVAF